MSRNYLEKLAHVCLILVSLIAGYTLLEQRYAARTKLRSIPAEALVGQKINLAAVPWEENSMSVVVALSSQCKYCVASAPFYRQLDAMAHQSLPKGRVSLTVVSPEPIESIQRFLASQGITVDRAVAVPLPALGLRVTPTLLLVDSKGIIRSAFAGKLKPPQEESVVKTLEKGA